jgi:hypothetical protein
MFTHLVISVMCLDHVLRVAAFRMQEQMSQTCLMEVVVHYIALDGYKVRALPSSCKTGSPFLNLEHK